MSITATNNPYPEDPDAAPTKLDRGGYEGNAQTLDEKITANLTEVKALIETYKGSKDLGSITPTSVPSTDPADQGPAFWRATQNGIYTYFGGFTVPVNNFAIFSRNVNGVFSVSMTALDISSKVNVSDIKNDLVSTDINKPLSANQGKILNAKFANYSPIVTESGKNLFNKNASDVLLGSYVKIVDGQTAINSGYNTTGYIAVTAGLQYSFNPTVAENAWYDVNKNFLSGFNATNPVTAPTNAVYARCSVTPANWNTFQFEQSATVTSYEAYKDTIKKSLLPSIAGTLIENLSVTNDKIAFQTITKEKTAFILQGKNLFNKNASDVVLGSYVKLADGLTAVNSGYNTTGYIAVTAGLVYSFSPAVGENAWYDVNKVFIGGFNSTNPVTAPTKAAFARLSVSVSTWNTFQVERSETVTSYEAYVLTLKTLDGYSIKADSVTATAAAEAASLMPNASIGGSKLIDASITPEKTIFFESTKNLFNPYDLDFKLSTYLDSNGNIGGSGSASLTGFIPITSGQTLFCNKAVMGGGYNHQYNSSKVLIAGAGSNTSSITGVAGAAYVRFSIIGTVLSTIIANKTQIEVGTIATSYMPFSVVKADLLPTVQSTGNLIPVAADMQLPSTLYLTNQKTDLFFTPLVKNFFKKDKFVRIATTNASLNRHFTKLATITPTANGTVSFTLYDDSYNIVSAKNVNTVITPIAKTGNLKTIFVGSSITRGAKYIEYIKSVCGTGVTFLGMRHENATGVQQEGRGGWGLASYFSIITARSTAYNPFYHPSTGRYWGSTAYWADVMTTAEFLSGSAYSYEQDGFKTAATNAGFLTTGKIAGAKLLTNDIMYDNALSSFIQWNGSAWNTISQPSTWGIDFVKYGAMWSIPSPDLFFIAELATNDFRGSSTDPVFTTWNAQVEQVLTALKVWNASAKLALTINFSSLGGDNNGTEFQERNNYRMWQCRKNVITNFDNRVGDGIYLIDNGIGFDEDYGFDLSTDTNLTIPNTLYTGSERLRVQTGNPHPNQDGNNLLGKCLVGIIQYLRA